MKLKETIESTLERLQSSGRLTEFQALRTLDLVQPLYRHEVFNLMPASRTGKHHFTVGGLVQHTDEVLQMAVAQMSAANRTRGYSVDWVALIVGAAWHDFGKAEEYVLMPNSPTAIGAPYKYEIEGIRHIEKRHPTRPMHHITAGTAAFFAHGVKAIGCDGGDSTNYWDDLRSHDTAEYALLRHVVHIIESHHGRREWSSPSVPATLEALAVHQADMLSVMAASGDNPGARS